MKLNRKIISVSQPLNDEGEEAVRLGKSEAVSFVWELTEEVYSLTGRHDVESRLQRNVVAVTRR